VTALVRYVAADALRAERWAAPVLVFLAATASFNAGGGSALSCYGFTAAVLLPVALWLTVSVSNSEDPVQEAVTAVTVGSAARVRLAKLLTAALVCVVLGVVSLVWSPVAGNPSSPRSALAGAVAHAVTIAAGVAFGAVRLSIAYGSRGGRGDLLVRVRRCVAAGGRADLSGRVGTAGAGRRAGRPYTWTMTAAYDYEDLPHLVDRLAPAQARRLRRLVTQDEELSRTAAAATRRGSTAGLSALIGSVTGPADLAEEHDRHVARTFLR
jgi:hypothetical protein